MKRIIALALTVMLLLTSAFAIMASARESAYNYAGESVSDIAEQYTADKRNKEDRILTPLISGTFTTASGEVFTSEVSEYELGVVVGWSCTFYWHIYNEDKSIDITGMIYSYPRSSTISYPQESEFYFEPCLNGEYNVREDGSVDFYYDSAYIRDSKTNRVCAEICFDEPMVQTLVNNDGVQIDISEYSIFELYQLCSTTVVLKAHPNQKVFESKPFMVTKD